MLFLFITIRDVTQPAKIHFHRIWILCFKSVGFRYGFVTQSQLRKSKHWIAIYWFLYLLNTKSNKISQSCLAVISKQLIDVNLFSCMWQFGKRQTVMNEWELYVTKVKSESDSKQFCKPVGFWICQNYQIPTILTWLHFTVLWTLSRITRVSQYQKGKMWILLKQETVSRMHQLDHMQICTSPQSDNHTSIPPLSFFTDWIPFLPPTNSVK